MRKSGMFDKNKEEIVEGCKIQFYYIDPTGKIHEDQYDNVRTVIYKYGAFGIESKTRFVPLFEYLNFKKGEYISNYGSKRIYDNNYPFYVVPF